MNPEAVPLRGVFNEYRVYGLRLDSAIPFPELGAALASPGRARADIELVIATDSDGWRAQRKVMSLVHPDGKVWLQCARTIRGYRLRFPRLAEFRVDHGGGRIACLADPQTPPETVRHLFLDQVLPPVLNLRGGEALHASAIETRGGALAFMGMSGQGKSTLAAAFEVAGYRVLGDDCLVLRDDPDRVRVEPAYPGLRLWDDSREFIFGESMPSLAVSHYNDKRRIVTRAPADETGAPIELLAIYSLQRGGAEEVDCDPRIVRLSKRDALMELISFAFRLDLSDHAMILRQMRALERVASLVPVKRLILPDQLAAIPRVRTVILNDLETR